MYQAESSRALFRRRLQTTGGPPRGVRVSGNVVALGAVSLLTDVASEMVAAILPIYLVFALGASPLPVRDRRRHLPGGDRVGQAGRRLRGRPLAPPQGGGGPRVRTVGACKAALAAIGGTASAVDRDRARRPRRQGHAHRTARRADRALVDPALLATVVRRPPGDGHGGRDAGPAAGVRPAVARADALRRGVRRQLCFAVRRARRAGADRRRTSQRSRGGDSAAGRRRGRCAAPGIREAAALLGEPRFRTLVVAAGVLALATVSDGFVYLGARSARSTCR